MQLSRPYMIALGAVVALAAAWMLLIRPHGSQQAPGSSTPAPAAPASSGPQAPGVKGLVNAVGKAHAAVAQSQQDAAKVSSESADTSGPQAPSAASAAAAAPVKPAATGAKPVFHPSAQPKPSAAPTSHATAPGSRAAEVSGPLAQGKVVVILFWDSQGADDKATLAQLAGVSRRDGRVVVLQATADQVASFGNVTKGLQILETPTTLVIDHRGQAAVLTGLTDTATIEQSVVDAERGIGSVQTPKLSSGTTRTQYIHRADTLCRTMSRQANTTGTLAQQITSVHALAQFAIGQINRVRAVPEPAADRVILTRWYTQLDRSMNEFDGAVSAVSAHHYTQARTLLFQGQADWDRSSQGLANYGLAACFPQESLTS